MPSSTANITRDELIRRSFRRIGIDYPTPTHTDLAAGLLNAVVKEIDVEGRWLWAINPTPRYFDTVQGQRSYPVGGNYSYAQIAATGLINLSAGGFNPQWNTPFTISFLARFVTGGGDIEIENLDGDQGFSLAIDPSLPTHFLYFASSAANMISITFDDSTLVDAGWTRFTLRYDGSGLGAGFSLDRDGAAYALTVDVDNLDENATQTGEDLTVNGGSIDVAHLAIFDGSELSDDQVAEILALATTGRIDSVSFEPLLTYYWPLNGSSTAAKGSINGADADVSYLGAQGNGIADNILRLEWAEIVHGTSRRPLRIIYEMHAISTIHRETTGEPILAFLQVEPQMTQQRLHLFPTASGTYRVNYSYRRRLYDFSSADGNPDFPQDWEQKLVKRLSYELCPEFGIPLEERLILKSEMDEAMRAGKAANAETVTPIVRRTQYF